MRACRPSPLRSRPLPMFWLSVVIALGGLATEGRAQTEARSATLEIPAVEDIARVSRPGTLSREEARTSRYILKTEPHPTLGPAYVVVTDHTEDAWLAPLRRLAEFHKGAVLTVEDLGALAGKAAREELARRLREAKVGSVALAPRPENFRENMVLGFYSVLASLDDDPELDARPGVLFAPDSESLSALVERSVKHQPADLKSFQPFVVGQLSGLAPTDTRSLQKLGIFRELFGRAGVETPVLVVRQFPGDEPRLDGGHVWVARTGGRRRLLNRFPEGAARDFDDASFVLLFGHGTPGVTCSVNVEAFDKLDFAGKVVLCGSCMSAKPVDSDFPAMRRGPDGAPVVNDRKRFLTESVERGAVVSMGHMRLNRGFPEVYPVAEALLRGETVGEAYQGLINALLVWTGLEPEKLVLEESDRDFPPAVNRRNILLYVLVGDPALQPFAPLEFPARTANRGNGGAGAR